MLKGYINLGNIVGVDTVRDTSSCKHHILGDFFFTILIYVFVLSDYHGLFLTRGCVEAKMSSESVPIIVVSCAVTIKTKKFTYSDQVGKGHEWGYQDSSIKHEHHMT